MRQYLEFVTPSKNIDSAGRRRSLSLLRQLPEVCAVYYLWIDNECVYVGCSKNLKVRFSHHELRKLLHECTHMTWFGCSEKEKFSVEKREIERLNPLWNGSIDRELGALRVPQELIKRLRVFCEADNRKMGTVATMAIEAWMAEKGTNGKPTNS